MAENHTHAILADGGERDFEFAAFTAKKRIGHLNQNARAIALQLVGADRATVRQVLQNLEALDDDVVALAPLNVGDKTHAAGVVFMFGIVQALCVRFVGRLRVGRWHFFIHSESLPPELSDHTLRAVDAETV